MRRGIKSHSPHRKIYARLFMDVTSSIRIRIKRVPQPDQDENMPCT